MNHKFLVKLWEQIVQMLSPLVINVVGLSKDFVQHCLSGGSL